MTSNSIIERRLADYGSQLDAAIDQQPLFDPTNPASLEATPGDLHLVDADLRDLDAGDHSRRPLLAVAAATVLLVGGVGIVLANRSSSDGVAVSSAPESDQDSVTPATEPGTDPVLETEDPVATVYDESGGGSTPDECLFPPATVYLGDPGDGGATNRPDFIVSAPLGTPIEVLARSAIVEPVVGTECGGNDPDVVRTTSDSATGTVEVTVLPPAAPIQMDLTLLTSEDSDGVGVTSIQGATQFGVDNNGPVPVLQLEGGAPSEGVSTAVRFRKGSVVWEVSVASTTGSIELQVPAIESDPEPDTEVTWVLFAVRDEQGFVVDTGGAVIS